MKIQPKLLLAYFFVLIFSISKTQAQNFFYSEPVGNYAYTTTEIIGRVDNNIIVWGQRWSNGNDEIWVYDDKMKLLNSISFASKHQETSVKIFINNGNIFDAVLQYIENRNLVCKVVSFDANAKVLKDQLIDSSINLNDFEVIKSPDKKSFAILKIIPSDMEGTIAIKYHFIKGDSIIRSDKIVVPFDTASSTMGNAFLDNDKLIIPIVDTMPAGARLSLFKTDLRNDSSINTLRDFAGGLIAPSVTINASSSSYIVTAKSGNTQFLGDFSSILVWQLNKDLTDISSDTIISNLYAINTCFKKMNYFTVNNITLKNKTFNIIISANAIAGQSNYFSMPSYGNSAPSAGSGFYEGRVLSMTGIKEFNGNGSYALSNVARGPTWYNNTGTGTSASQKKSFQPASLAAINVDRQNNIKWSQCFSYLKDKEYHWSTEESIFLSAENSLYIVYSKFSQKGKQLLENIKLNEDGSYTVMPIICMNLNYNYLLGLGTPLDSNSILIPCTIQGKLAFAKLTFFK